MSRTVQFLIDSGARRWPKKAALKFEDETVTYRQLADRAGALANAMVKMGLVKGGRAAILSENTHRYMEIIGGAAKGGFILCTLNNLLHTDEIAWILKDAAPSVLFFDRKYAPTVATLLRECTSIKTLVAWGQGDLGGLEALEYDRLIVENDPEGPGYDVDPDDTLLLVYTSGTTGRPKGAMLTQKNVYSNSQCLSTGLELPHATVTLAISPMFHVASTNMQTMTTLYVGGTTVIMKKFDIKDLLEIIQKEKVSFVFFVPTMIYRILDYPDVDKYDLSSLRHLTYGSAPIFPNRLERAREVFGPVLYQLYGLTEATSTSTVLRNEDHVLDGPPEIRRRLNSCGREYSLHELRIVGEDGKDIKPGEVGEIAFRSESVMKGYWNNPAATQSAIRGGWLYTGDLATFDDDYYVYLVDRKSNMIISGGENVYPKEIEETIIRHEKVKEVSVIGIRHPEWGETPKAIVAPKEGAALTGEEIIEFCKANLSKFKCPRKVVIVDELPRGTTGKIDIKRIKAEHRE